MSQLVIDFSFLLLFVSQILTIFATSDAELEYGGNQRPRHDYSAKRQFDKREFEPCLLRYEDKINNKVQNAICNVKQTAIDNFCKEADIRCGYDYGNRTFAPCQPLTGVKTVQLYILQEHEYPINLPEMTPCEESERTKLVVKIYKSYHELEKSRNIVAEEMIRKMDLVFVLVSENNLNSDDMPKLFESIFISTTEISLVDNPNLESLNFNLSKFERLIAFSARRNGNLRAIPGGTFVLGPKFKELALHGPDLTLKQRSIIIKDPQCRVTDLTFNLQGCLFDPGSIIFEDSAPVSQCKTDTKVSIVLNLFNFDSRIELPEEVFASVLDGFSRLGQYKKTAGLFIYTNNKTALDCCDRNHRWIFDTTKKYHQFIDAKCTNGLQYNVRKIADIAELCGGSTNWVIGGYIFAAILAISLIAVLLICYIISTRSEQLQARPKSRRTRSRSPNKTTRSDNLDPLASKQSNKSLLSNKSLASGKSNVKSQSHATRTSRKRSPLL